VRERRWIALAAILGVSCVYFDTWNIGLWWDDYLMLRPATAQDVARAFHGTWDPSGVLPSFYRPLTVAYQAVVANALGANLPAVHLLSMALIALGGWLLGLFVVGETRSLRAAALAAVLYGVHPAVARSQGPWFFLQYHSLCTIVAAGALLMWQTRRLQPAAGAWWPVFALGALGFLIREDMVMLVPALVVLQAARARWMRDVPAPAAGLWLAAGLHMAALLAARQWLLGVVGGPGLPEGIEWVLNSVRGPIRTLAVFQPSSWPTNLVASAMSLLVLIGGLMLGARRPLLLTGAVILLIFNLPLALASSSARFHMLALGGVLMLTAAHDDRQRGTTRDSVARRPFVRHDLIVYGVFALLIATFALASRAAIAPQRPCGAENLHADAEVMTWPTTSVELRAWLVEKEERCRRTGQAPPLDPRWLRR
jgi:hypothetical protein